MLSATDSASSRFCSTSRMAETAFAQGAHDLLDALNRAWARGPRTARPSGSASGSPSGRARSRAFAARRRESEPPMLVEPLLKLREFLQHLAHSPVLAPRNLLHAPTSRKRAGWQRKIFPHRERFEDAPPLRNDGDARPARWRKAARSETRDPRRSPRHGAAASNPRWCGSAWSCPSRCGRGCRRSPRAAVRGSARAAHSCRRNRCARRARTGAAQTRPK